MGALTHSAEQIAQDRRQWSEMPERMPVVRIGVDIGQRVDPTAICVTEIEARLSRRTVVPAETFYVTRHVERLPIGTTYPEIGRRIADLVGNVNRLIGRPGFRPDLLVDSTGVGRPAIDILRQSLRGTPHKLLAVNFVAGDRLEQGRFTDELSMGKQYLVSRMQALLQTGRVRFPDTAEARALAVELQDYEIRVSSKANVTAGAFGSGKHDDLATAWGLSVLLPPIVHRAYKLVDAADLPG